MVPLRKVSLKYYDACGALTADDAEGCADWVAGLARDVRERLRHAVAGSCHEGKHRAILILNHP
jgi:hypothetical protein